MLAHIIVLPVLACWHTRTRATNVLIMLTVGRATCTVQLHVCTASSVLKVRARLEQWRPRAQANRFGVGVEDSRAISIWSEAARGQCSMVLAHSAFQHASLSSSAQKGALPN